MQSQRGRELVHPPVSTGYRIDLKQCNKQTWQEFFNWQSPQVISA